MKTTRQLGEELFSQHFRQIERIIQAVSGRNRMSVEECQELYSLVMLKVIQDDYEILRGFQGKSRWSTYLTVIIQRVLLDHRVKEWGRWRPCARARRLGASAAQLDRRINRDGLQPSEAIHEMLTRGVDETAAELERLAEQIPRRPRRRLLRCDSYLQTIATREKADQRVVAAERHRSAAFLESALAVAMKDLPAHERKLLGMRFGHGWTVRRIAASQNLEERPLYRRFDHILRQLRRRLECLGLAWTEVASVLDGQDADLEINLL